MRWGFELTPSISPISQWIFEHMLNYILLIIVSALGMAVLDEDRNHVSMEEWVLYAVMLYSAYRLITIMVKLLKENGEL